MSEWINLKTFFDRLIGTYTPITTGEGMGTVDWPYIMSALLFIIILYCFFKVLFRLIK